MSVKYAPERPDTYDSLWNAFASEIVDTAERFRQPPGRLLDIGCDVGHVLAEAQRRRWDVEGLEINPATAALVEKRLHIVVHRDPLEEAGLSEGAYSVVVCNHVLEHVPAPAGFLRQLFHILAPGGVAFIGTPCFTSVIPLLLLRERWHALLPIEHVWQFGPRSLPRLLGEAGFEIVYQRRGCTRYWGRLAWHPRVMARWAIFRGVALLRQGDFFNYVVRRP